MKKKIFLILPGVISILLTGVLLTTLAFQYFRWEIRKSVLHELEEDACNYTGMITNKVDHYVTLMLSLNNLFKFSETVTRDEFAGFTTILLSQESGIKALCWAPRVEQSQRLDYEMNVRKEGFSKFAFHGDQDFGQPAKTCYFPAYYVEPFEKNSSLFGLVLNGSPVLSKAFEKAVQTGRPTSVTNPLAGMSQKPANSDNECWVIIPVFGQHNLSCTEQERRQHLEGYLFGIIDISEMMDHILCGLTGKSLSMDFHIEDVTDSGRQLYTAAGCRQCLRDNSDFNEDRHRVVSESRFEFVDRTWKVYCTAGQEALGHYSNAWMVWLVFPVGGLLTGLLVLYLYTLYCRNELAGILVEKRTYQLKEQKEKADVIAMDAERSNRAKSAFLAGMSHDIRTPMNVIVGFCELLADESLNKDQKFYVQTILSNSKNLLMLLSDILDLSKIEVGKLHIDKRDFDLQELLGSIELMFRVSTQNRGLDFRIISMSRIPRLIRSDPLRIRQCLVNLIGNAIKFTRQGHIYLNVFYEKERLKLSVEDTGIGIPQGRLDGIFNAFSQVDCGGDLESESGSGLGLAITRQLARLMEGDITVQSQTEKGSVFTLDIPAVAADDKLSPVFQDAGNKDGWEGI